MSEEVQRISWYSFRRWGGRVFDSRILASAPFRHLQSKYLNVYTITNFRKYGIDCKFRLKFRSSYRNNFGKTFRNTAIFRTESPRLQEAVYNFFGSSSEDRPV